LDRGVLILREQRVPVGYPVVEGPPKTAAGEDRHVELDGHTVGVFLAHRLRQDAERAR
jgi:hypothetical protein